METDQGATSPKAGSPSLPSNEWCEGVAYRYAPDLLVLVDPDLRAVWTNDAVTRMLGFAPGERRGSPVLEFVHPDDRKQAVGAISESYRRDGYHLATRMRLVHAEGTFVDTRVTATTVEIEGATWFVLSIRPVADEVAIEGRRRRLRGLANTFYVECASMEWTEGDQATRGLLGTLAAVLEASWVELAEVVAGGQLHHVSSWAHPGAHHEDGSEIWVPAGGIGELRAVPCVVSSRGEGAVVQIWLQGPDRGAGLVTIGFEEFHERWDDANADVVGLMCSSLLATVKRCVRERALAHAATRDPLTDLLNRSALHDRLSELMAVHRSSPGSLAVVFADLNDFKRLNDTQGHREGDAVLMEVANAIRANVRTGDLAARVGGDEFVVAMAVDRRSTHGSVRRLRSSIERAIAAWPGVGVALGTIVVAPDDTPDDVLQRADLAMYRDKRDQGRNRRGPEERATLATPLGEEGRGWPGRSLHEAMASLSIALVVDADGLIVTATPAAYSAFGFDPESIRGTDVMTLIHPDDLAKAADAFAGTIGRPGSAEPIQLRATDAAGRWHAVEVIASNQLDNPDIRGVIFTVNERTPTFAPTAVSELVAALDLAVAQVDAAVYVLDADRQVVYASPATEELLGAAPGELVGRAWVDIVARRDRELAERQLDRRQLGVSDDFEIGLATADGRVVEVEAAVSPLSGADGCFRGAVGVLTPLQPTPQRSRAVNAPLGSR